MPDAESTNPPFLSSRPASAPSLGSSAPPRPPGLPEAQTPSSPQTHSPSSAPPASHRDDSPTRDNKPAPRPDAPPKTAPPASHSHCASSCEAETSSSPGASATHQTAPRSRPNSSAKPPCRSMQKSPPVPPVPRQPPFHARSDTWLSNAPPNPRPTPAAARDTASQTYYLPSRGSDAVPPAQAQQSPPHPPAASWDSQYSPGRSARCHHTASAPPLPAPNPIHPHA